MASTRLLAREADPRASVILQYKIDPFLFVQRKPLLRRRLREWIILTDRAFRLLKRRSGDFPRLRINLVQAG